MPELPQYVSEYRDRHGKVRYRFRRKGISRPINANPGSPAFKAIVAECLEGWRPAACCLITYPEGSVVYFVGADEGSGAVKIGWSTDLKKRMSALNTGSSRALTLLAWVRGGRVVEAHFHKAFKASRVNGEWFKRTPDLVALIADLATHSKLAKITDA